MVYNNSMEQKNKRNSFFYCIRPLLLLFLVDYVVSFVFILVCCYRHYGTYQVTDVNELMNTIMSYTTQYSTLLNIICAGIMLLIAAVVFFKRDYKGSDYLYDNKLNIKDALSAVCAGIGMFMLVNIVIIILSSLFDMTLIMTQHDTTMQAINSDTWLDIVYLGFLGPACEEILVRGLCFNRFKYTVGTKKAIVISAILFAALHFTSVLQMGYAFALGVLFAYAYDKYKNILVPIFMHMSFNLMNYVFDIPAINNLFTQNNIGYFAYYVLSVAISVLAYKLIKNKKTPALKNAQSEHIIKGE